MRILGIETSCDEAAAALVQDGTKIISNVVASSQEMHTKTGGIIPEQAAREQIKCMIPVIEEALSGMSPSDIDAIAVTYGPGLIGSLLVGVETAKTLAYVWKKPIVPINHLVGHIYANFVGDMRYGIRDTRDVFPAMVLIVSGGHTELVLMKDHGKFQFIGGTRDDAAGEAFDKIARILNLGYPGGPAIQKAAGLLRRSAPRNDIKLPRPMMDSGDFDFSFSGLKTALLRLSATEGQAVLNDEKRNYLAFETQEAITDVLVEKTIRAAQQFKVKSIFLSGGVSANLKLREKLKTKNEKLKRQFILSIPPIELCTDNAVYIASCAYFNYSPIPLEKITAEPGLEIV